jgi:hypothetical protein
MKYTFPDNSKTLEDIGEPKKVSVFEEGFLSIISENESIKKENIDFIFRSMKNNKKRDWFTTDHIYHCPPVVLGNQLGFLVVSEVDMYVNWNGGQSVKDLHIDFCEKPITQLISSHFGMGTVTFQNRFQIRTSEKVNIIIVHPINYVLDYTCMGAYIETDNLRRDFTFNIRINKPGTFKISKGDPIGLMIPSQRHYIDSFNIKHVEDEIIVQNERNAAVVLGRERAERDLKYEGGIGKRYYSGQDGWGQEFKDHQKKLDK